MRTRKPRNTELVILTFRCSKATKRGIEEIVRQTQIRDPERSYSISTFIRDAVRERLHRLAPVHISIPEEETQEEC